MNDTLNYLGDCTDVVGQVVGPTWLDEYMVAVECSAEMQDFKGVDVDEHDCDKDDVDRTSVRFEPLTKARQGFLTDEAKRSFVTQRAKMELESPSELPSRKEIERAEEWFRKGQLWIDTPIKGLVPKAPR